MPPTAIVALRLVPAVLAATLYPTEPVPEPEAPLVIVSHDWLLVAVREQPVCEVTVKLDVAPLAATELDVGVSV